MNNPSNILKITNIISQLPQTKDWILELLYKRIILILILLFLAGIGIAITSMSELSSSLIESQALQTARQEAQNMQEARSLYNSEVVSRAQKVPGIEVTHDYLLKSGAIPLPATYLRVLGYRITERSSTSSVRVYSRYPYPWRKEEGSAKDNFEKEALKYLENNPQDIYYRIEDFKGRTTLRYAQGDVMKANCIACHNSHPDSPKRDWQIGELRGVLEINKPLDKIILQSQNSLKENTLKLGTIGILAILGLALVIGRLKFINQELDILVKRRTAELNTANIDLENARQEVTQLRIQIDQEKHQKEVNEILDTYDFDSITQQGKKWRQDIEEE